MEKGVAPKKKSRSKSAAASSAGPSTEAPVKRQQFGTEAFAALIRQYAAKTSEFPLPHSPWIALSSDSYRVRQFVKWIGETLLSPKQKPTVYFGGDLTQAEIQKSIIEALSIPSLFEPRQVIVIYSAENVKEAVIAPIVHAAMLSRHASLILHIADEKKLPKSGGSVITFEDLTGAQLQRWIERELKRTGTEGTLERAALEALANRYEGALMHLSHEIEKIALTLRPGDVMSLAQLQKITPLDMDADSFNLVHEIARRNVVQSTALTRKLIDQGLHPLQIVAFLSRCLRTLLARGDRSDSSALHSELTNYYFRKNVENIASQYTQRDLARSVIFLSELDLRLKTSGIDPEVLIELATTRLSTRRFELALSE